MEATVGGTSGDPDVAWFNALFASNHDDLFRYAVRRVGSDAASDVVAEAFLVAWRRRAEVPTDLTRLWLFQVAARLVANERRADFRRGRLRDRAATDPTVLVAVPDPADAVVERVQVLTALAKLPARDQEALRLIEWDGLRIADAACIAGCSPPAFRVRLHRARRRFAMRLADLEQGSASSIPRSPTHTGEVAQ